MQAIGKPVLMAIVCGLTVMMTTLKSILMIGVVISQSVNGFGLTQLTNRTIPPHLQLAIMLDLTYPSSMQFMALNGDCIITKQRYLVT